MIATLKTPQLQLIAEFLYKIHSIRQVTQLPNNGLLFSKISYSYAIMIAVPESIGLCSSEIKVSQNARNK